MFVVSRVYEREPLRVTYKLKKRRAHPDDQYFKTNLTGLIYPLTMVTRALVYLWICGVCHRHAEGMSDP